MRSSRHRRSLFLSRAGFSIIEIVVVLGVAAVVFGSVAVLASVPNEESALREEHGKIEDLALAGRTMSVSYQQSFVIEFRQGRVLMRPQANPMNEIDVVPIGDDAPPPSSLAPLESMAWPREVTIDPDYDMLVRHWGQQNYVLIKGDTVGTWLHEPNGLCEPISILLTKDDGDNSLARIFHPLTGLASDEQLTITGRR